jgi:hypothetical protein
MPPTKQDLLKIPLATTPEQLSVAVATFQDSFDAIFWGPRNTTVDLLYEIGTIPILIHHVIKSPLISLESGSRAWTILSGMCVDEKMFTGTENSDDAVIRCCEYHVLEVAIEELRYDPSRFNGFLRELATTVIQNSCASQKVSERCLQLGLHVDIMKIIQEASIQENGENEDLIEWYLFGIRCFAWLARYRAGELKDLTPGIVHACVDLLKYLNSPNHSTMMLGFTAAKTIIRIVGKDENSTVIHQNPTIIDFYSRYLRRAIVNRHENVSISGQVVDLALISLADKNKPLMFNTVSAVTAAVDMFGINDSELLYYSLLFLSQISSDELCKQELKTQKHVIDKLAKIIHSSSQFSIEERAMINVVVDAVK